MKKSKISRLTNLVLWGAVGYALISRAPSWIANFQIEGEPVQAFQVSDESGAGVSLPKPAAKQVVIFWATWCGPCTVELSRFNSAVKDGDLKAEDVLAISLGEDPALVYAEAKQRDYRFTVLVDPQENSRRSLRIDGTPQTYHIDAEAKIVHAGMGLSPLAVWRAESFLKPN